MDTGRLSAGAEQLRIAQPPLGRQIRDLERFMGATLFERSSRGMQLTAAGNAFLPRAQDILASIGEAVDEVRLTMNGNAGRLAIGYSDEFLHGLLPKASARFLSAYGDVRLELEMNYNADTAIAVREGRYDAGFVIAPAPSHLEGISVRLIDTVPLYVAIGLGQPVRLDLIGPAEGIVGEDDWKAVLARAGQSGGRIRHLGSQTPVELAALYPQIDLHVLASTDRLESFDLVQVEAMAAGVPCVATDRPGMAEPIRQTGMGRLFAPATPEALRAVMVQVLRDGPPRRVAPAELRALFGPQVTCAPYLDLLKDQRAA